MSQDLVSFVLRFVREVGEDQQARWRGVIKHVQGDTENHFTQFSEALSFMQERMNETLQTSFEESKRLGEEMSQANPLLETARMWGEFMPQYTRKMMDSMSEMVDAAGGGAARQQMEQMMESTMAAWGLPTSKERESAAASLESISQQLAELATKVADLESHVLDLKKDATQDKEN